MENYKWIFASSRGSETEMTEVICSVDEAREYMLLKIAAEAEKLKRRKILRRHNQLSYASR